MIADPREVDVAVLEKEVIRFGELRDNVQRRIEEVLALQPEKKQAEKPAPSPEPAPSTTGQERLTRYLSGILENRKRTTW